MLTKVLTMLDLVDAQPGLSIRIFPVCNLAQYKRPARTARGVWNFVEPLTNCPELGSVNSSLLVQAEYVHHKVTAGTVVTEDTDEIRGCSPVIQTQDILFRR